MSFKETEIGTIPEEWDILTIDDIKSSKKNAISMGPFGSKIKKEFFTDKGIPVIRGNNLKPFVFQDQDFIFLPQDKAEEMKSSWVFRNDIVITHRGTLGQVGYIPENSIYDKYIVSQSGMKLTCNSEIVVSKFVYYFLLSRMGQFHLLKNSSQVGVPAIAQASTSLKKIPVPIPSLQEQKAIAHILSTLDEKIEVNNKINKTLEEMAQTIFKHWFVDFEFPNEDGEPYKSSGGEMVDSELGPIPKGWEVTILDQVIELHDSKRIPLSGNVREKMDKIYPYYGAAALMDYVDNYIFEGNYILLGEDGTVITDDGKPILQYVWGKFWVNNHAHVIKGKKGLSINFVYNLLKLMDVNAIITGAVQKKINQGNLLNHKLVLPKDISTIDRYSSIISSLYNQYMESKEENIVLESIRDTLLPKLMSGEIRVPIDNEE